MDTLFGWPQAADVTPLQMLGLLGGVPLVVIIVIFVIAKANAAIKTAKLGPGPRPSDPIWEGGRARSIMGGAEDELTAVEAATRQRQLEATPSTPTSEAAAGGASARW